MEFKKFENLLKEASNIVEKIPIKEKTFMDISGYPYYENVCSNILAFYFKPKEEHKLKEIALESLIKVVNNKNISTNIEFDDFYSIDNEDVKREYITSKGNRIDLVIQNDNIVIGIENKLEAEVYNDLTDYANTLNKLNVKSIKILLSLHNNIGAVENTEFINVTYQEYFAQLKKDLNKIQDKNNKWYIFLEEFIKNLESFEGELKMEEEIIRWLRENRKEIEELDKIREIAYKSMEKTQEELKTLLEERLKVNYIKIWKGNNNISCYIDSPYKYHADAKLSPDGWKIGIFTWTTTNSNRIKQIILNSNYNIIEDDGKHRWLYTFGYNTPVEEILNKIIEINNYMEKTFEMEI